MNDHLFIRIVSSIYDAAAAPELWPRALDAVIETFDAVAAHLCLWDRPSGDLMFTASSGNASFAQSCEEEFGDSARYCVDDTAAPGPRDAAMRVLDDGFSAIIRLGRGADAQGFQPAELSELDRLKPHFHKAVRLQHQVATAHRQRRLLAAAQDHLPFGVIVANSAGAVLSANHSAERTFTLADGLTRHHGVIATSRSDETTTLLRLIAEAASVGGSCGMIRISRPSRKPSYAVLVAPLRSKDRHHPPLAMLVCTDPAQYPYPSAAQLAQVFGFTTAEARLATKLANGKRLEDISAEAGVSKTTLRTQLRAVMDKTETNRQADLIRLILSLPTVRKGP